MAGGNQATFFNCDDAAEKTDFDRETGGTAGCDMGSALGSDSSQGHEAKDDGSLEGHVSQLDKTYETALSLSESEPDDAERAGIAKMVATLDRQSAESHQVNTERKECLKEPRSYVQQARDFTVLMSDDETSAEGSEGELLSEKASVRSRGGCGNAKPEKNGFGRANGADLASEQRTLQNKAEDALLPDKDTVLTKIADVDISVAERVKRRTSLVGSILEGSDRVGLDGDPRKEARVELSTTNAKSESEILSISSSDAECKELDKAVSDDASFRSLEVSDPIHGSERNPRANKFQATEVPTKLIVVAGGVVVAPPCGDEAGSESSEIIEDFPEIARTFDTCPSDTDGVSDDGLNERAKKGGTNPQVQTKNKAVKESEKAIKGDVRDATNKLVDTTEGTAVDAEDKHALKCSDTRYIRSGKKRKCPICLKDLSPFGFYMHFKKCQRYKGWECEFCHNNDVYSFAPQRPWDGPNGPRTLCPDCGKKYLADMQQHSDESKKCRKSERNDDENHDMACLQESGSLVADIEVGRKRPQRQTSSRRIDYVEDTGDNSTYSESAEASEVPHHPQNQNNDFFSPDTEGNAHVEKKRSLDVSHGTRNLGRSSVGTVVEGRLVHGDSYVAEDMPTVFAVSEEDTAQCKRKNAPHHPRRKRKPIQRLDPDARDRPKRKSSGPHPDTNSDTHLAKNKDITHHFTRQSKRLASVSTRMHKPCDEALGPEAEMHPQGQRTSGRCAKYETNEVTCCDASCTWSDADECALLTVALKNPLTMIQRGVGAWMLREKSDKDHAAMRTTSDQHIKNHWNSMLHRAGVDGVKTVSMTSPQHLAFHVLSACFAEVNHAARTVALLSAGWHHIPPDIVDSLTKEQSVAEEVNTSEINDSFTRSRWHRPSPTARTRSKLSEADYLSSSSSISKAWDEHILELRQGIEKRIKSRKPGMQQNLFRSIPMEKEGGTSEGDVDFDMGLLEGESNADGIIVPNYVLTMIKKRKANVLADDPRPSLHCMWCGPKWEKNLRTGDDGKDHDDRPSCPGCGVLFDNGWRMIVSSREEQESGNADVRSCGNDYRYSDPDGVTYRSVKAFLTGSTRLVCDLLASDQGIGETAENTATMKVSTDELMEEKFKMLRGVSEICSSPAESDQSRDETDIEDISMSSDGTSISESHDNDPDLPGTTHKNVSHVQLPTIYDLIRAEQGLEGILKADEFHTWNTLFGTDATIALKIVLPLATGKLPKVVQYETPFFRSKEELMSLSPDGGAPPTRFLGVTRITVSKNRRSDGDNDATQHLASGKLFGVEFPLFEVDYDTESVHSPNKTVVRLPRSSFSQGKTVFLRADIEREDVAGQLYSFIFRLFYGLRAAENVKAQANALKTHSQFSQDTLKAFGARKNPCQKSMLEHESGHL